MDILIMCSVTKFLRTNKLTIKAFQLKYLLHIKLTFVYTRLYLDPSMKKVYTKKSKSEGNGGYYL